MAIKGGFDANDIAAQILSALDAVEDTGVKKAEDIGVSIGQAVRDGIVEGSKGLESEIGKTYKQFQNFVRSMNRSADGLKLDKWKKGLGLAESLMKDEKYARRVADALKDVQATFNGTKVIGLENVLKEFAKNSKALQGVSAPQVKSGGVKTSNKPKVETPVVQADPAPKVKKEAKQIEELEQRYRSLIQAMQEWKKLSEDVKSIKQVKNASDLRKQVLNLVSQISSDAAHIIGPGFGDAFARGFKNVRTQDMLAQIDWINNADIMGGVTEQLNALTNIDLKNFNLSDVLSLHDNNRTSTTWQFREFYDILNKIAQLQGQIDSPIKETTEALHEQASAAENAAQAQEKLNKAQKQSALSDKEVEHALDVKAKYTGAKLQGKSDFISAIKDEWGRGNKAVSAKLFEQYKARFPGGTYDPSTDKSFGTDWADNYNKYLEQANRHIAELDKRLGGVVGGVVEIQGEFKKLSEIIAESKNAALSGIDLNNSKFIQTDKYDYTDSDIADMKVHIESVRKEADQLKDEALAAKQAFDEVSNIRSEYFGVSLRRKTGWNNKTKSEYDAGKKSDWQSAIKSAWDQGNKPLAAKLYEQYQANFPKGSFDPSKQARFGEDWVNNYAKYLEQANRHIVELDTMLRNMGAEYGKYIAYFELDSFANENATRLERIKQEGKLVGEVVRSDLDSRKEVAHNKYATGDQVIAQDNLNKAVAEYNRRQAVANDLLEFRNEMIEALDDDSKEYLFEGYKTPADAIQDASGKYSDARLDADRFAITELEEAIRVARELGIEIDEAYTVPDDKKNKIVNDILMRQRRFVMNNAKAGTPEKSQQIWDAQIEKQNKYQQELAETAQATENVAKEVVNQQLFDTESGQLAFIEGVKESIKVENELQEELKETNTVLEGQISMEERLAKRQLEAIQRQAYNYRRPTDNNQALADREKTLSGRLDEITSIKTQFPELEQACVSAEKAVSDTLSGLQKSMENIVYHAGVLSRLDETQKSRVLGNVEPYRGGDHNLLTGLYTTQDLDTLWGNEWTGAPISTIDVSKYKLFDARDENIANKAKSFFEDLNAAIYGYQKYFDYNEALDGDSLKTTTNVKSIEDLYAEFKEVFKAASLDIQQFSDFIEKSKAIVAGHDFKDVEIPNIDEGIAKSFASVVLQGVSQEVFNSDSFPTQLMKMLGYEGFDVRGNFYDNTYTGGTVLFDVKPESLRSVDEKWSDVMARNGYEIDETTLQREEKRRQLAFETAEAYSKMAEESHKIDDSPIAEETTNYDQLIGGENKYQQELEETGRIAETRAKELNTFMASELIGIANDMLPDEDKTSLISDFSNKIMSGAITANEALNELYHTLEKIADQRVDKSDDDLIDNIFGLDDSQVEETASKLQKFEAHVNNLGEEFKNSEQYRDNFNMLVDGIKSGSISAAQAMDKMSDAYEKWNTELVGSEPKEDKNLLDIVANKNDPRVAKAFKGMDIKKWISGNVQKDARDELEGELYKLAQTIVDDNSEAYNAQLSYIADFIVANFKSRESKEENPYEEVFKNVSLTYTDTEVAEMGPRLFERAKRLLGNKFAKRNQSNKNKHSIDTFVDYLASDYRGLLSDPDGNEAAANKFEDFLDHYEHWRLEGDRKTKDTYLSDSDAPRIIEDFNETMRDQMVANIEEQQAILDAKTEAAQAATDSLNKAFQNVKSASSRAVLKGRTKEDFEDFARQIANDSGMELGTVAVSRDEMDQMRIASIKLLNKELAQSITYTYDIQENAEGVNEAFLRSSYAIGDANKALENARKKEEQDAKKKLQNDTWLYAQRGKLDTQQRRYTDPDRGVDGKLSIMSTETSLADDAEHTIESLANHIRENIKKSLSDGLTDEVKRKIISDLEILENEIKVRQSETYSSTTMKSSQFETNKKAYQEYMKAFTARAQKSGVFPQMSKTISDLNNELNSVSDAKGFSQFVDNFKIARNKFQAETAAFARDAKALQTQLSTLSGEESAYGKISANVRSIGIDNLGDGFKQKIASYESSLRDLRAAMDALKADPIDASGNLHKAFDDAALKAKNARVEIEGIFKQSQKLDQVMANMDVFGRKNLDPSELNNLHQAMLSFASSVKDGVFKFKGFNKAGTEMYGTLEQSSGAIKNVTVALKQSSDQLFMYGTNANRADNEWEEFKNTLASGTKNLVGMYVGFQEGVQAIRSGVEAVKQIDLAMTELKKVTDETDDSYREFLEDAGRTSAVIGSTVSDFAEASATFARLGYSLDEASSMAETAIVYKNVADGLDTVEESSESIISTMMAFGIEASDTMGIIDRFNAVGKGIAQDNYIG